MKPELSEPFDTDAHIPVDQRDTEPQIAHAIAVCPCGDGGVTFDPSACVYSCSACAEAIIP